MIEISVSPNLGKIRQTVRRQRKSFVDAFANPRRAAAELAHASEARRIALKNGWGLAHPLGGKQHGKVTTYLVSIDFSRGSDKAFDHAVKLTREHKAKLIFHVVPAELIYPPTGGRFDFYGLLERDARDNFRKLLKRKHLQPKDCGLVLARGTDFAEIIARQAKRLRASMIVIGSHGRTGLSRFLLGSVAERTLRYAACPVLIVK